MHACWILLDIVVHVVKYFLLCIIIFQRGIGKIKKSNGGLASSIPRPEGGLQVAYLGLRVAGDVTKVLYY
jgi:hypothetical protein